MGDRALANTKRTTMLRMSRSPSDLSSQPQGEDANGLEPGSNLDTPALGREALVYADTLYNLAHYLTGNAADAEDLVQETFRRAIQAADRFTRGTNLKAWLFRILRNTFISSYRRQRHNPTIGGLDTVDPGTQGPAHEEWLRGDLELHR